MSDFFWDFFAPFILVVAVIGAVLFGALWGASAEDTWQWTNIDDNCGVFTTQKKSAWFNGPDGPLVREVYCRK